jgi:hypothetical protein
LKSAYDTWFFLLIILIFSFLFYYPAYGAWYYDYENPDTPYYNTYKDLNPKAYYRIYKYPKDKKKTDKKKEKISTTPPIINQAVAQEQARIYSGLKPAIVETSINYPEEFEFPVLPQYPLDRPYRPFYWGKQLTLPKRLK